jgi:hypothetical protein
LPRPAQAPDLHPEKHRFVATMDAPACLFQRPFSFRRRNMKMSVA